jgi:hypothetical protein
VVKKSSCNVNTATEFRSDKQTGEQLAMIENVSMANDGLIARTALRWIRSAQILRPILWSGTWMFVLALTGCASLKPVGQLETNTPDRMMSSRSTASTAPQSFSQVVQTGYQDASPAPALTTPRNDAYPPPPVGYAPSNAMVPNPQLNQPFPPYGRFQPGYQFAYPLPGEPTHGTAYRQNGLPPTPIPYGQQFQAPLPNNDVFAEMPAMDQYGMQAAGNPLPTASEPSDSSPGMPSAGTPETGLEASRGYLQDSVALSGSVLNPSAMTATRKALALRDENQRLTQSLERLKKELNNRTEELAEANLQISQTKESLATANQDIEALKQDVERLNASLTIANQTTEDLRRKRAAELRQIQSTLETAVMETLSRPKK